MMCEYVEGCTKVDDPLAVKIWRDVKTKHLEPVNTIECSVRSCLLGVIIGGADGYRLVVPHRKVARDLIPGAGPWTILIGFSNPTYATHGFAHLHAGIVPMAEFETAGPLSCRCGVFRLTNDDVSEYTGS